MPGQVVWIDVMAVNLPSADVGPTAVPQQLPKSILRDTQLPLLGSRTVKPQRASNLGTNDFLTSSWSGQLNQSRNLSFTPTSSDAPRRAGEEHTSAIETCSASRSSSINTPAMYLQSRSQGRNVGRLRCRQMFYERVLRRKASWLVFLLTFIESFVFTGAVEGVLQLIPGLDKEHSNKGNQLGFFIRASLLYSIGRMFYPVGGFLADVYIGRYRVINISLWLYWVAFALLSVANTLDYLDETPTFIRHYVIPIIAYVCIVLASGGFQSTIIPFGVDQLEAPSSNELSSYFYSFSFAIQAGAIVNVVVISALSLTLNNDIQTIVVTLLTLAVITLGLILHYCFKSLYFIKILQENCIKVVIQVLWFAATVKRRMPLYRRAFRYGGSKKSRIELAKHQYDGIFPAYQVENVKTFCRITLIILTIGGYFYSMTGVSNNYLRGLTLLTLLQLNS